MKYLEKFITLEYWTSVTGFFLIVVIVYFLYSLYRLVKIASQSKKIEKICKDKDVDSSCLNNKSLSSTYKRYKETVIFDKEGAKKTDELSSDYLNIDSFLQTIGINRYSLGATSGILVGLGLLGTFLGLSLGVSDFTVGKAEEMINSIKGLLGGMGTAFDTSLFGMGFSALFILAEKITIYSANTRINALCNLLDDKYYISSAEKYELIYQRQNEQLVSLFTHRSETGEIITPGNVLRDIYSSSEQQSSFMAQFIEEFTLKLETIAVGPLTEELRRLSTTLSEKLDGVASTVKSPGQDLANSVVSELQSAINEMVQQLQHTISNDLNEQMKTTIVALSALPETLNTVSSNMSGLVENLNSSASAMSSSTNDAVAQMKEQQRNSLNSTTKAMEDLNESIDSISSLLFRIKETIAYFEEFHANAKLTADRLAIASNSTVNATNNLMQTQKTFQEVADNNKVTTEILGQAIQESTKLSQEYKAIQEGLKPIFTDISEGLNDYSKTVSVNTEKILSQYGTSLNKAVSIISGAIEDLSNVVDELSSKK